MADDSTIRVLRYERGWTESTTNITAAEKSSLSSSIHSNQSRIVTLYVNPDGQLKELVWDGIIHKSGKHVPFVFIIIQQDHSGFCMKIVIKKKSTVYRFPCFDILIFRLTTPSCHREDNRQ